MNYDVFISSKSEDYPFAGVVYDFLEANGVHCFLASRELDKIGEAQYSNAIDDALDQSEHMVVVASSAEHIRSKWVQAEWGTFVNDLRSNYRNGNLVNILCGDIQLCDLPPRLRHQQTFLFDTFREHILAYVCKHITVRDDATTGNERVGGGQSNCDERLKKCLDEAQILYSIDKDGDFQTQWSFDHDGTSHTVAIELISRIQQSEQQGLVRNVSGYFLYNGDVDILRNVLEDNKWDWRIKQCENGYLASSTFTISANIRSQDIRNVCEQICSILREVVITLLDQHNKKSSKSGWWEDIVPAVTLGGLAALGAALSDND